MAKKITAKERREALKNRTRQNAKDRDKGGGRGKSYLDFSEFEEVNFYKPQKGRNSIDILPYLVSTNNHPQSIEIGYEDYVLDIWVHFGVGPAESRMLCLKKTFGQPCPICEEMKALRDDGETDDDVIKGLSPKRRCIYNVIDLTDEDKGIQVFDVSHFLFEKEMLEEAETADEGIITFADLEDGRSIHFRASETSLGSFTFLKFKSFKFEHRDSYNEEVLETTFPLDKILEVPSYEEVRNAFMGVAEGDDDDAEEEEDDGKAETKKESKAPTRGKKTQTRSRGKKAESKEAEGECPHGYNFGTDCDESDDCKGCNQWDACADKADADDQ